MNPLQINPTTGFLDSPSVNVFGSDRKVQFLNVCKDYRKTNRRWPDFGLVCEEMGITRTTFERHLKSDPKFAEAFRDLTLGAKYQLESNLFDLGTKKGFEALIWLRRHFPEEYNPDYKVTVDVNPAITSQLLDKAQAFEADIVEE
jgi:hypothetical protein